MPVVQVIIGSTFTILALALLIRLTLLIALFKKVWGLGLGFCL